MCSTSVVSLDSRREVYEHTLKSLEKGLTAYVSQGQYECIDWGTRPTPPVRYQMWLTFMLFRLELEDVR